MKIINKTEVDKFIWETTQMGAIATALKANFEGDLINVAYQNSITNETVAVIWSSDAHDLEQQAKGVEDAVRLTMMSYTHKYSINLLSYAKKLREQAKQLKGQDRE